MDKLAEAVAARRNPDTLIIGRSNGVRASNMDDALRRGEAYRAAGADLILLSPRNPEEVRHIADRLGGPLMLLLGPGGLANFDMSLDDMAGLGYRILADPSTPLTAAYEAMRDVYAEMANGFALTSRPPGDWRKLQDDMHETIGLEHLLEVERRTVEKG